MSGQETQRTEIPATASMQELYSKLKDNASSEPDAGQFLTEANTRSIHFESGSHNDPAKVMSAIQAERLVPIPKQENQELQQQYEKHITMTKQLGKHYMDRYRKRGVPLSPAILNPSQLAKAAHAPSVGAGFSLTQEQLGNMPTEVLKGLWSSYQQLSALDSERYSSAVSQGIQADEQDG